MQPTDVLFWSKPSIVSMTRVVRSTIGRGLSSITGLNKSIRISLNEPLWRFILTYIIIT